MANMMKMMKQAQQMQKKMQQMQEELHDKEVEFSAGGGKVIVVATGGGDVKSIKIDPGVVDPEDVELLEDDDYYSGQLSDEAATKEQSQAVVALAQAIGKDYNRIQDDLNSMTTRMSRHEVTTRSNLGRVSFFGWLEVVGFMLLGGANVLIVMSFFSDSAKTTGARRRGGLRY